VFTILVDQSMSGSSSDTPQFLSHHGGSSNASTSAEYTTFFFDVAQEHLCEALDRLVSFLDPGSRSQFPGLIPRSQVSFPVPRSH